MAVLLHVLPPPPPTHPNGCRVDVSPTDVSPTDSSWMLRPLNKASLGYRVSFETSFDSKQPKLEPKQVSALSETKRLFRLFRFFTETESFDVSIEPKQTKDQPKQFDREHILQFFTANLGFSWFFSFFSSFFSFFSFFSKHSLPKQRYSMFRLNRNSNSNSKILYSS